MLKNLLQQPDMADTAVVINEFGEIGLDHLLVEKAKEDTILMSSGCLCCSIRGDLIDTLRRLYKRRERGEVPQFKRLVIETTGLADPAPILQTLIGDPLLSAFYRLDGVITTVDAVNGMDQLDRQFESVKQAAVADRLVLTKTDLAERGAASLRSKRACTRSIPRRLDLPVAHGGCSGGAIVQCRSLQSGGEEPRRRALAEGRGVCQTIIAMTIMVTTITTTMIMPSASRWT